jgi:chemotaxis protein methyltransferase CheR
MRNLSQEDFAFVARLLNRRSGLLLTRDKEGMLDQRVRPVLRRFGLKDQAQLLGELRLGNDSVAAALAEAVTVNDTWFFRDPEQFDAVARLLPSLMAARADEKRLRIWSAGCASGQEAYSIAMLLDEMGLAAQGWTIDLLATDLSAEAIGRAEAGHYGGFEVQRGLSPDRLERYFRPEAGRFQIVPALRRMVQFRRFNLLDSFGWLDGLDLVFCRNVMLYFDSATRQAVLTRIAEAMAPHGLLLPGETESLEAPDFRNLPQAGRILSKAGIPALRHSA